MKPKVFLEKGLTWTGSHIQQNFHLGGFPILTITIISKSETLQVPCFGHNLIFFVYALVGVSKAIFSPIFLWNVPFAFHQFSTKATEFAFESNKTWISKKRNMAASNAVRFKTKAGSISQISFEKFEFLAIFNHFWRRPRDSFLAATELQIWPFLAKMAENSAN